MRSRAESSLSRSSPTHRSAGSVHLPLGRRLKVLTAARLEQIDVALESVGPFGEVRLIVTDGQLQFIHRVESQDLLADRKREFERR